MREKIIRTYLCLFLSRKKLTLNQWADMAQFEPSHYEFQFIIRLFDNFLDISVDELGKQRYSIENNYFLNFLSNEKVEQSKLLSSLLNDLSNLKNDFVNINSKRRDFKTYPIFVLDKLFSKNNEKSEIKKAIENIFSWAHSFS